MYVIRGYNYDPSSLNVYLYIYRLPRPAWFLTGIATKGIFTIFIHVTRYMVVPRVSSTVYDHRYKMGKTLSYG